MQAKAQRQIAVQAGHVAVVGATGYVGQALVPLLLGAGHTVTLIARRAPAMALPGTRCAACDAADPPSLLAALGGADYVINALNGSARSVLSTARTLADAVRAGRIARLVHISSLAVFGEAAGLLREDTPPRPPPWHRYAVAKWRAEASLHAACEAGACAILRPGCIYGPGAPIWTNRIGRLLRAGRLGHLGGAGEGLASVIHVNDMARAVVRALAAPPGIHHLLPPVHVTWNGYFDQFAVALGMPGARRVGPLQLRYDIYVRGPASRAGARLGWAPQDVVSPAMARLFASRARITTMRSDLLPQGSCTPWLHGLADAALALGGSDTRRHVLAA